MEYPVWWIPAFGGGLPIALMAVIHVFVAHFAVGGGLFLVFTEMKAYREDSPGLLEYVRSHTKFFLLLTMVFGGLTGVGIWFTIALLSPAVTSTLIHTFVFGWATEWVFFLGEITALLLYFYYFKSMNRRDHLILGWLYFAFAWLSLFMINGIVGFMLTPGAWLQTGDFWDGFFNPSFWPSLVFRSAHALIMAGLFAFVTALRVEDRALREKLFRYAAWWVGLPFLVLATSAFWYLQAIPAGPREMILAKSREIAPLLRAFLILSPAVLIGALAVALVRPRAVRGLLVVLVLFAALLQFGTFEWIREAGRRPYLIQGHTWSNSIPTAATERINRKGILASAKWTKEKSVNTENQLAAGREIFAMECLACHSIGGPLNDILPLTAKFSTFGLEAQLNGQGRILRHMPEFFGLPEERKALAAYIVQGLHGRNEPTVQPYKPAQLPVEVPPFNSDEDEYVLLAWNSLGMHCISDSDPYWILLPPANDLYAQLFRRGDPPEVVTDNVVITYRVEPGFESPAKHVRFWEFAESLVGAKLQPGIGLGGKGVTGEMDLKEQLGAFSADLVPVVPYPDDGSFNPYPIFTVEAHDAETGRLLASTRMVAPTSTEMGCRNCHGGEWRVAGVAGFSDQTAADVLAVHDRINGTSLLAEAEAGKPRLCQSCHPDPVLKAEGKPGVLNFPAAIHGWHANYLTGRGPEACYSCHPASAAGPTGCLRGVHSSAGLDCTSCHGKLEDHALSLLKMEDQAGKSSASELMRRLDPRTASSVDEINPRTPWLNEPDCAACHDHEKLPARSASSYNKWTSGPEGLYRLSSDETGSLMCGACHGSTHANYPAVNIYGKDRDTIQPLQYQKLAGPIGAKGNCGACHTGEVTDSAHHPIIAAN